MTLYDAPNITSGLDDALFETAQSVPAFPIMILVFTFFVVLLGGSANQKKRIGRADYPFWFVLASMTTMMLTLLMTLGEGMIDIVTLGIVVGVTILSGVWFFLSKVRGEP